MLKMWTHMDTTNNKTPLLPKMPLIKLEQTKKEAKTMTCKNNKCEHKPTLKHNITNPPTPEQIRYAQLWEEIQERDNRVNKILKGEKP